MKFMFEILKYTVMPLLSTVFIFSCTSDTSIAGGTTETTSANVIGTIRYENKNRAAGVTVKLIPAGFNPSIDSAIDSVVTNEQGNYSFKVSKSGYFNLSAQSQDRYCYTDSIPCREDNLIVVNDTLSESGSVKGRIQMATSGRLSDILILVMGTNTYTTPDSITGIFSIPYLAEGEYVFRILSHEKLYEYIDITVIVSTGKNTILPEIVIPFANIPELENIQSTFDSKTMQLSLSWPSQDTSDIAACYVYRNSGMNDTPLAVINCPDTFFNDDLLFLNPDSLPFGDTIRYCVAAIGKDRTFKKISSFRSILLQNTLITVDSVILPKDLPPRIQGIWEWLNRLYVDKDTNYYFYGNQAILKVNQTGQLIGHYSMGKEWIMALSVDNNGYVYAYDRGSHKLTKFTPELKGVKETTLNDVPGYGNYYLIARDDGFIDLLYTNYSNNTFILTLDSTLAINKSTSISSPFYGLSIYNKTFSFNIQTVDPANQDTLRKFFDINNNIVKTVNEKYTIRPVSLINTSCEINYALFNINKRCLTIFRKASDGNCALLILNPDNTVYGRAAVGSIAFFDGISKLYSFDTWRKRLYIYTID